eukprot:3053607-Amphidinium_carterae.1
MQASTMQTSRDAEDMAFAVVLSQTDENERQDVYVDCQGTIGRARQSLSRHMLAKDPRAHMWINREQTRHLDVHKVKAHRAITARMTHD